MPAATRPPREMPCVPPAADLGTRLGRTTGDPFPCPGELCYVLGVTAGGGPRSSRPRQVPATVRTLSTAQAATRTRYRPTAAQRNTPAPVCRARPVVPVTRVPTGNVKDHQVRLNGRCCRAARIVIAVARPAQSTANPQTGTP